MLYFVKSVIAPVTPEQEEQVLVLRPAHQKYVRSIENQILIRGPLFDENGYRKATVMIAEFEDLATAKNFVTNDPLNEAGIFSEVIIKPYDNRYPTYKLNKG